MRIAQNKIRFLYYTGTISIVFILLVFLGVTSAFSFSAQTRQKIQELADGILSMKKIYVKDVVERTIQDIDIERQRIIDSENARLGRVWDRIDAILAKEPDLPRLLTEIRDDKTVSAGIDALCLDRTTGKVLSLTEWTPAVSGISGESAFRNLAKGFMLTLIAENDRFAILLGITGEYLEAEVKANSVYRIRKVRLVDDGYIWVNWILDYAGGEKYAIRLVHPNLPETEGSYLSTETRDTRGNKPYLAELEGVKKEGELYNDYWFKKMDSDVVAHKLSYAKHYKPYDWVIATGVYLDDIDALAAEETASMRRTQRIFLLQFIGLGGIALFGAIALIVVFERRLEDLIKGFQTEVTEKNSQLELEKKRIEDIAYLDPLTALLNRRAMYSLLEQSAARAARREGRFTVAIGDIDFFKRVNDTYGHLAGDRTLTDLSAAIKAGLRSEDSLSRWGGEEFLVLLPDTSGPDAEIGIERLRETVESLEIPDEGRIIRVTMSFGVASWTSETASVNDLIKLADCRLYEAKERGRNRVIGESSGPSAL